jgi:small subunit ribosomal protein S13
MEKKNEAAEYEGKLIRILSKDIPGKLGIFAGLTKIRGISWSMANLICQKLNMDKRKKIGSLAKEEIDKINNSIKNLNFSDSLLNRRKDISGGEGRHLLGTDLELQRDFDVGRLKKIRSYRGLRHSAGQPVRGQRTRSHFRKNKKRGVGIKKKGKPEGGAK